jgi:hypothetical protein
VDVYWSVRACRWVASPRRDALATPWSVTPAAAPGPVVDLTTLLPLQRTGEEARQPRSYCR